MAIRARKSLREYKVNKIITLLYNINKNKADENKSENAKNNPFIRSCLFWFLGLSSHLKFGYLLIWTEHVLSF